MTIDAASIVAALRANGVKTLPFFALSDAELERTYAPGKWTIRQLLAHLADREYINLWRFSRAAAEPGSKVASFEENDWARRLDYAHRPAVISRDLFAGARHALMQMVGALPEERLLSTCVHPEKGEMPAWRWARLAINHCEHHHGQIEAARDGIPWVKKLTENSWEFGAAPKPAP